MAELWNSYEQQGTESGYSFLVHRNGNGDEAVGGFACYGPHPLTEGTFDLYWIAVDPALRGRGIAHALLSRVEEDVRAQGGRLLVVETSSTESYCPARHFYESCGYQQEATVRSFYGAGDDLIMYTKILDPTDSRALACSMALPTENMVGAELEAGQVGWAPS